MMVRNLRLSRSIFGCAAATLMALGCATTVAADTRAVISKVAAYRSEDLRLEHPVNLRGHGVPVGELLEELSAQSGVQIKLGDPRDGAGDDNVSFAFPNTKLADVMEAVWGLLSYRDGEFLWRRSGSDSGPVYELWRPPTAQRLPQLLQAEGDRALERQLLLLKDAASAPKEVLDKLAQEHQIVKLSTSNNIALPGIRTFFDTLTPDERRQVLSGNAQLQRESRTLNEAGRQFVDAVFNRFGRNGTFGRKVDPVNGPAWVRFYARELPRQVTRSLMIELDGLGAYSYAGGTQLNDEVLKAEYARWMLPDDALSDTLEQSRIPNSAPDPGSVPASSPARANHPTVAQRIDELAATCPVPFIARLRWDDSDDPGSLCGSTLKDVLERLCSIKNNFQKKWRGGVLLLTAPDWYLERNQAMKIPWLTARTVRTTLRRSHGLPSPQDLQTFAGLLSDAQLEGLAVDYSLFQRVREWHTLLITQRAAPALWDRLSGARGLPVSAVQALGPMLNMSQVKNLLADDRAVAIQCQFRNDAGKDGNLLPGLADQEVRSVVLQTLDAQGQPRHGTGFAYRAEAVPWWVRRGDINKPEAGRNPAGK